MVVLNFESSRHALAYLMGVYLSDGSTDGRGAFRLGSTDVEFRDEVAAALSAVGSRCSVGRYTPKTPGWKVRHRLWELAPYRVGWWLEVWVGADKNHLPSIPDGLARDLVAGILDGDGCIGSYLRDRDRVEYALRACGRCGYLKDLRDLFARFGVVMHYHPKREAHYINLKSFVSAGFYFRMPRKQALVEEYRGQLKSK